MLQPVESAGRDDDLAGGKTPCEVAHSSPFGAANHLRR
jgi:hypothetical protein